MYENEFNVMKKLIPVLIESIMKIYEAGFDVSIKKDNSPVTEADKCANNLIVEYIKENFDNHYYLAEESKDNKTRINKDYVWVIDPIDGTKEFVKKNGEFAVNIGMLHNDVPVLGIVIIPIKQKYYYAIKNQGAYVFDLITKETKRLLVSKNHNIKGSTLTISRSHSSKIEDYFIKENQITNLVRLGSAYKVCNVAEGNADFYIRSAPLSEWDICAPLVIIEEANGMITDFNNQPLKFNKSEVKFSNGIICSNKLMHNQILECLKNYKH